MREEVGSDGRTYQLINNEWVPIGEAPEQPGRMPGPGGVAMEAVNAVNYEALGMADFLTAGQLNLRDRAGEYGIGSQAGYMDPGIGRDIVQGAGRAVPGAAAFQQVAGRNLATLSGAGAEFAGFGGAAAVAQPITKLANRLQVEGSPGTSNMVNRLAETISGEVNKVRTPDVPSINPMTGEADNRVLQGYLYPEEVSNIMQRVAPDMAQDITPGQKMLLLAETTAQKLHARDVIRNENVRSSDYGAGASLRSTYDTQRELPGLLVKEQLGIPLNKAFTIEVVGDTLNELGKKFDAFANDVGTVSIGDDLVAQLDNIAELAVGNGATQVVKQVNDIKRRLEIGGSSITGQEWQQIRTQLADAAESAKGQGEFGWGNNIRAIQDVMIDAMEGGLSPLKLDDIRAVRKQWSLAENVLSRAGNINADRTLSAKNLYNSIFNNSSRRKSFMRNSEAGDFKRQLETLVTLGDSIVSDSGTPLRLSAQAGNLAKSAVRAVTGSVP